MDRGEMLNEPGDSWFSPKCLEGQPRGEPQGVRRWMGQGASAYRTQPNHEYLGPARASETAGAKLRRQEGNNPDHQLRSLSAD